MLPSCFIPDGTIRTFFFYFVLESFFELRFKDFLDTKIEHEIEEPFASEFNRPGDPEAINGLKVMRRSLDLLLGILFQYVVTLTVISYFLATSYLEAFDQGLQGHWN